MALAAGRRPEKLPGMTQDTAIFVRNPADLVNAAPYIIGFHPTDSLVVLGLSAGRIFFGARHDLPPPEGDDIVHLGAVVAAQRARSIALLVYGPPSAADPVVRRALQVFDAFRIRVAEAIRVHEGRWWSYYCVEGACCPPDGTPYDTANSVIAAEATYRGQVVLPSRQALTAQVAPLDGPAREAMADATARACETLQRLITDQQLGGRAVRRAGRLAVREAEKKYRAGGTLTDDEVAWLGVLLIDPDVFDYTLDRQGTQEWRLALWTDVLRRVETDYVPPTGCVLSYLAWRAGNGALARVAIDRALHGDPQFPMAALLDEVLALGIGPHVMTALDSPGPRRDKMAQHTLRFAVPRKGESPASREGPTAPGGAMPSSPNPDGMSRRERRVRRALRRRSR